MPTDPPSANQTNPPGPLGQAQPPAQQLPQHQTPYQFVQQHQSHIPLHPPQQGSALQHPQYGVSAQGPLHSLSQAQAPRQSPQPHQPQQQQRAPLGQQQSYFPVNGYQQPINPYPGQQFQMGNYIYQSPTAYPYPMPGANAPQQQPPVNSRPQRQFPQSVGSNPGQRASTRTIPVPPPRKKNILQIVDPDTNEEVKVSKVETRPASQTAAPAPPAHPPVKIPPRKSHALELVSDPADEARDTNEMPKMAVSSVKQSSAGAARDIAINSDEAKVAEDTGAETQNAPAQKSFTSDEKSTPPVYVDNETKAESKVKEAESGAVVVQPTQLEAVTENTSAGKDSISLSETVYGLPKKALLERELQDRMEAAKPRETSIANNPFDTSAPNTGGEVELSTITVTTVGSGASEGGQSMTLTRQAQSESLVQDTEPVPQVLSDITTSREPSESTIIMSDSPSLSLQLTEDRTKPNSEHVQGLGESTASDPATMEASAAVESATATMQEQEDISASFQMGSALSPYQQPVYESKDTDDSQSDTAKNLVPASHDSLQVIHRSLFQEGARRVYVPSFMWNMKSMPNVKMGSEYEAALGSRDILKNGSSSNVRRNDSRGNRPARGGAGPLSTDPRRAFPGQGPAGFQMVPMRGPAPPGIGAVGLGSYDAFDLRSARSQAPPPAPKGQSSVRDGDPRGARQQGARGRFDGPTRQGQTPIDPFVMHPPVEKLKRTEKGWKRNRDADDEVTAKVKTVRSLLNKLTLEKFEKIFKQIVDVGISSYEVLDGVVTEIFEKTLFEPKFSGMYAELCRRLEGSLREVLTKSSVLDPDGKPISFRKILLNHCRDEFTRFAQSSEAYEKGEELETEGDDTSKTEGTSDESLSPEVRQAKAKLKKHEEELKATNAKRRMLANVRFIGELFLKDLLREQIIHKQCIQKLLALGIEKKEEDTLEALCKLVSKTGAKLSENKDATEYIDNYFAHLELLSGDHTLPARIRFMLQDLIEQRANNWKVRREEVGAKTIAEIHQDIEKEERAKQEAQAAARERRNRGGGIHGRDRNQQNFTPRVAMTMASSRRAGPNVSRTNSVIEKFGNRGTTGMPNNNFQSLRLGPGGARPIGAGSGGSGPLRPGSGSGMFGSFAALTDNRESGINGQSGDARRSGKAAKLPATNRRAPARSTSMPPDKLKQKTKSVVQEFWSVGLLDEVRQTLTEEVQQTNYPAFVEETIRISIDAKVDESEKSVGLLRDLAIEPLSGVDMVSGFSTFLSQLADLEMDNPRVAEFLGKYIGAVASTRKLPEGSDMSFGLEFVCTAISENEDPKRVAKVIVSIFSTMQKEMMNTVPNETNRTKVLKDAYISLGVDIAGLMNAWNPMRGLSVLENMLKNDGVSFLAPYIKLEQNLQALFRSAPAEDQVQELLKSCFSLDEDVMRTVVRQSLDWILMTPVENVKESFCSVVGAPLMKVFGNNVSKSAQLAALLEAQFFIARNMEILRPMTIGAFDKPGAIAFDLLYEAEIVSRDTFVEWKEDTGRSSRVPGKEKMVMQTSQFFQWLAQLQQ